MLSTKPILTIIITLTIILEVVLIVGVYDKIGTERLPVQMARLFVQLILIYFIYGQNSSKALFLLAAYHVLSGMHGFSISGANLLQYGIGGFHILAAIVIYFYEEIQNNLRLT